MLLFEPLRANRPVSPGRRYDSPPVSQPCLREVRVDLVMADAVRNPYIKQSIEASKQRIDAALDPWSACPLSA